MLYRVLGGKKKIPILNYLAKKKIQKNFKKIFYFFFFFYSFISDITFFTLFKIFFFFFFGPHWTILWPFQFFVLCSNSFLFNSFITFFVIVL